ncbi:MMPL family transporter [Nocardia arthritidis]|uniref:MMPL family transporter n=1 Tax=Nocardia arthritidis TaxID=228602 RepID=A0A6G9YHN9_9NOCA|nr:MMPL family transporter [Nocardia arthritidis]QIS12670.1 MMPL family transporter [Nocardia arthritidis]
MATFLNRLGRFCFEKRRIVVLFWLGLLAVLAFCAARSPDAADSAISMPGTESQRAFDLLDQRFPGLESDGADARIVFAAPPGQQITAAQNKPVVDKVVADVAHGPQIARAVDPFQVGTVSQDRTTAYASISYNASSNNITDATKSALEKAVDAGRASGLTVEFGGTVLQAPPEMGATEVIGVAVAAVVLLITFGSLAAAGLPLITALVGIGCGVAAIVTLGQSFTTSMLAMMLGLAVGIDYALFIVSRYRAERAAGHCAVDAAGRAVGTAGSAVVFAGLTVVIALTGLSVVGLPVLTKMGSAAAGTVLVSVLIALTLLPALLGFLQNAVLPRGFRTRTDRNTKDGLGVRWARFVIRRPVPVLLIAVAGLGALALPVRDLTLGMPSDATKPTSTTQRRAYDALAAGFGVGANGPFTVVVDAKDAADPKAAMAEAAKILTGTKGIVSVSPPMPNQAGDTAVLTAIPATSPTADATKELVHTLRAESGVLRSETGARMLVTGSTAVNIDMSQKLTDALLPYLAVVVGLAILLLIIVFRSLLVPLKAALGFLLSVGAALGVIVAVFQWGWLADQLGVEATGPVMSLMPIFLIGLVFGLAMDYEVFLVTRIREAYAHGESPAEAVVTGFRHNAKVVAAAATIMIAVFAGFAGTSDSMIKMMGIGLAAAVSFDAFVVRMSVVPAVLALLGDKAWWLPRRLGRILPNVDIEGDGLRDLDTPDETGELVSAHE